MNLFQAIAWNVGTCRVDGRGPPPVPVREGWDFEKALRRAAEEVESEPDELLFNRWNKIHTAPAMKQSVRLCHSLKAVLKYE